MPKNPAAATEKETSPAEQLPRGQETLRTVSDADEGVHLLAALKDPSQNPQLLRRIDRVIISLRDDESTNPVTPQERSALQRPLRDFLVKLGSPANSSKLIEAYQVATVKEIPAEKIAAFQRSLPSTLTDRFSPYDAALCLGDGVTAQDISAVSQLPLNVPKGPLENGDLANMLRELCGLPGWRSLAALCDFKTGFSHLKILVGKSTLVNPAASPNLFRGLLVFAQQQQVTPTNLEQWQAVADEYARAINDYLAGDKVPQAVFYLGEPPKKISKAFAKSFSNLKESLASPLAKGKVTDIRDLSAQGPAALLSEVRAYVTANPNKPFLVNIALHGLPSGGARYDNKQVMTPQDFRTLAMISPNITIQVDGCYAGASLPDAGPGTILLESSLSQSFNSFQRELSDAMIDPNSDLDGDGKVGWREARLVLFLRWRKSFLPTSFTPNGKGPIRLAATPTPSTETNEDIQA